MKPASAPPWLASFAQEFAAILRAPLGRDAGMLRACEEGYDSGFVSRAHASSEAEARARFATYNRQYWFRLFQALQQEYPLTCAISGAWAFNQIAEKHIERQPPRHHEISRVGDDFTTTIELLVRGKARLHLRPNLSLPSKAVLQSAAIDEAFRKALAAESSASASSDVFANMDPKSLDGGRLRPANSFAIVAEDWPLLDLRRKRVSAPSTHPASLPAAHRHGTHYAAIVRTGKGIEVIALAALQAHLYRALCELPISAALAELEHRASAQARTELPLNVQRWLALSVKLGFWQGVSPC